MWFNFNKRCWLRVCAVILAVVGLLGVLGTAGAADLQTIGVWQMMAQLFCSGTLLFASILLYRRLR